MCFATLIYIYVMMVADRLPLLVASKITKFI